MSIQIIDNFLLNTSLPIDTRIVASGSNERNAIQYKYEGLRVYDTADQIPYVWLNGSWQFESASNIAGTGSTNQIAKFTNTTVLADSIITESISGFIGIDNVNPVYKLDVNGQVFAGGGFVGDGSQISNINASNITNGNLSLSRLSNGSTGNILVASVGSPTFSDPSLITVGTSSATLQANFTQESVGNTDRYIPFVDATSGNQAFKGNLNLRYRPGTSQLLLSAGTNQAPTLSFIGTTTIGLYRYSTTGLGITTNGSSRMIVTNDGISQMNSSIVDVGGFIVGNGTEAETTKVTISSVAYDRVVYVYSSPNGSNFYISAGWVQFSVYIDAKNIFSSFYGSDSGIKSMQINYCFILPAGKTSYVKCQKSSLAYNVGLNGHTVSVSTIKFGLS